jgi:pyrophosphate--fructose-6-phosphate 1-phosphotransferase
MGYWPDDPVSENVGQQLSAKPQFYAHLSCTKKAATLTAGGIALCLSSAVAPLTKELTNTSPDIEIVCDRDGDKGWLLGDSFGFTHGLAESVEVWYQFGRSPIGTSRVKLTNVGDCIKGGFVKDGEIFINAAADQLENDKIDILYPIGGDDTNGVAAALASHLKKYGHNLQVIGLPTTVANALVPFAYSLGANMAAKQSVWFFEHIVVETTGKQKTLIIHEVVSRKYEWLTAASAFC